MFSKIFSAWTTLVDAFVKPFSALLKRNKIDAAAIDELRTLCINADMGVPTTERVIAHIQKQSRAGAEDDVKLAIRSAFLAVLNSAAVNKQLNASVVLLVGINGSGKTTTAAKLAYAAHQEGKRVLLVAADTFRAAAVEQLQAWASRFNITCIAGAPQQDPASVVFMGVAAWKTGAYDYMVIDTAGRLQTKTHLMEELSKMRRVLSKQLPRERTTILLTLDSTLGQNSLEQARLFHEAVGVDGIILTKCDGSGKGGIIFAVVDQLGVSVQFVTTGEGVEHFAPFNAEVFVDRLLGS